MNFYYNCPKCGIGKTSTDKSVVKDFKTEHEKLHRKEGKHGQQKIHIK